MPEGWNELVAFAREPVAGSVKTRLAASIGDQAACEVYRAFLVDLAARVGRDPRWRFTWAFTPADAPFPEGTAGGLPCVPQSDGDLGRRLAAAFRDAFARGATKVAVIGSDLPHLDPESVAEAFAALERGRDLVLGPAEDGGYYLIAAGSVPAAAGSSSGSVPDPLPPGPLPPGASAPPDSSVPPVFDDVPWSGPGVLARTLDLARAQALSVHQLAPDFDVDEVADLERLAQLLARHPGSLPATTEALERVGDGRFVVPSNFRV